jgi:hypothetical protein
MSEEELRTLDAEVHRRVFGQEVKLDMAGYPNLPRYSSEIHRAWLVLEALNAKGWLLNTLRQFRAERGIWSAEFNRPSEERREYGDSAAEAICRAALLCVRETP